MTQDSAHGGTSDTPVLRPVRAKRPFASVRAVTALILREMSTTYGRSPGGYFWAFAEPAIGTLVLVLIFSVMLRSPPLGTNFAVFYASGIVPFMMYMDVSGKVATALRFSRALLAYPSVTFMDAILARFILSALTQLAVGIVLLGSLLWWFDTANIIDLPTVAVAVGQAMLLGLGIGTLNAFLFHMFPLWERFWGILTRPLFFISCIFFIFQTVPQPYRDILWYNPLVHVVGYMRGGLYPFYDTSYVSILYVFGIGAGCLAVGLLLLRRYHLYILNN